MPSLYNTTMQKYQGEVYKNCKLVTKLIYLEGLCQLLEKTCQSPFWEQEY